jgi:uncharacterized membrane protein YhaH (DUF805 family)
MLGLLFGFNARLGRLHYFLSSVALAIAMTLIAFAIASFAYQHTAKGAEPVNLLTWPVLCAGALFFWVTFTLQSMRIRDIGWDPVCVIPVWAMIMLVDKLVAVKMPVWSVGKGHHETVVGLLIFFALACCLAFWPSGPETGSSQPGPGARRGREEFRDTPRSSPPVPSVPQTVAAARTGFGRRGV